MTPERWQQIERLYHAALERTQAERAAFLDAVCADDADLRTEVDSLLAASVRGGMFLDASALQVTARALASELPRLTVGQRVGS
jgi:ketosteroid isomerase-like protein